MKSKFDWKELEKKAEIENQIKEKFELLRQAIIESGQSPFINTTQDYKMDSELSINSKIRYILDNHQYPSKDKKNLERKFRSSLKKDLDLIFNKEALCLISFESVTIFKFFKALSSIFDDFTLKIQNNDLYICNIDKTRKVLTEITIFNDSYNYFKDGKIRLDLFSLSNALKAKASDLSQTSLIFGEKDLYIEIISKKFKSTVNRVIEYKKLEEQIEIPINELKKIQYPCRFQLTKDKLQYLKDNTGFHSEKLEVICKENLIQFIEVDKRRILNEIIWNKTELNEINIDFSALSTELEQLKKDLNEKIDENLQNQMIELNNYIRNNKEKHEIRGKFWIHYLIICLKIMNILKNSKVITFFIRDDKPLKSEIIIEKLGDTKVRFYLAPSISCE
jgi:hypothetical protein